ncbi:MAG: phospholipase D-like domain-containing protein [Rhizobacter sp.]
MDHLLTQIELSIADERLSDDEKRALTQALRQASPPEEGLRQLRNRAFDLVRERVAASASADDTAGLLKWLEGVVRSLDVGRAPQGTAVASAHFSPGTACLQAIVDRLRAVRRQADLCVFTLSDDRITSEVLAAHARGVAVRIVTDNDKEFDAGSDIAQLRQAGVPVAVDRTDAHMHHKFALFDGTWLLNGSYNWTRSAAQFNEENLVVHNDPGLVRQFQAQFDTLWTRLR